MRPVHWAFSQQVQCSIFVGITHSCGNRRTLISVFFPCHEEGVIISAFQFGDRHREIQQLAHDTQLVKSGARGMPGRAIP